MKCFSEDLLYLSQEFSLILLTPSSPLKELCFINIVFMQSAKALISMLYERYYFLEIGELFRSDCGIIRF